MLPPPDRHAAAMEVEVGAACPSRACSHDAIFNVYNQTDGRNLASASRNHAATAVFGDCGLRELCHAAWWTNRNTPTSRSARPTTSPRVMKNAGSPKRRPSDGLGQRSTRMTAAARSPAVRAEEPAPGIRRRTRAGGWAAKLPLRGPQRPARRQRRKRRQRDHAEDIKS